MYDFVVRGTHCLIVPQAMRKRMIELAHESHQGIVHTKQHLREIYWWPKMDLQTTSADNMIRPQLLILLHSPLFLFSGEGNPCELVLDNGSQFVSHEFSKFLQKRGIQRIKPSVYYTRSNGEVEIFNRVLKHCLQTATLQGQPWKPFTLQFLADYRSTPHAIICRLTSNQAIK